MAEGKKSLVIACVVVLFFLCAGVVDAKYVSKKIKTKDKFTFFGKFTFDTSGPGHLLFTPASNQASQLQIATFNDEANSWPKVWHSSLSCEEMLKKSSRYFQVMSGVEFNLTINDHTRPHAWYLAVANCAGTEYELDMTAKFLQFEHGVKQQFSFEQQGLIWAYLFYFLLFTLFVLVHLWGDYQLFKSQSLHPIIRLMTISLVLQLFSLMCIFIHYAAYAGNGIGAPALQVIGNMLDMLSTVLFMFLLILIAKGWGITFPSLSHIQDQRLVLAGALVLFFVMYVILFFWQELGLSPASDTVIYQSAPGFIYLVVRLLTMGYFIFCLVKTFREDTDSSKRTFYVIFGTSFSLWFVSIVLLVLVSFATSPWYRIKIIVPTYLSITAIAYGILIFLLWPSTVSKYFQVAVPDLLGSGYAQL